MQTPNIKEVFVIEDDAVFAQVLTRSLTARGYTVEVAHTVDDALVQLEGLNPRYIILDLFLGGDSGLSLLPVLRSSFPSSKILVLTGFASISTTVQAIKLGADNYLPKPANTGQILSALEQEVTEPSTPETAEPLSVERLEWEHIQTVLAQHEGNISATARALGMHRRTLQRKLNKKPSKK